ncbi:Pkinase-domain-containing protein [Metschnikowia bicuspidata var. bicuspidata NRRL YB-4993]|uniref:non-specific serine/threonine protein kinase n=1 Tax=Metschnikowia bicuspidata var. bicuspidata NRRL YB-4993 TaxID=869754 RepID=A0A1A0H9F7_9ASCO|nr:Pkinase-domain-containing protein [Metschnikowia bicuspidata var. bicuspidata NRRL YB-4993]OBA20754.1 Pkinase-domain-containing protein [Metschnikowia bicuspidata var. bicuspidata NRRL YB-4993]
MPDRHKLKLFGHFKPDTLHDEPLDKAVSNLLQHGSGRRFLGFHIGRHESQDSLASPTLTNSLDHRGGATTPPVQPSAGTAVHSPGILSQHHSQQQDKRPAAAAHDESLAVNKSVSMSEIKRLFKPTRKTLKTQASTSHDHHSGLGSPGGAADLNMHSREPLLASLAALIQNTLSQLLQQLQHQTTKKGKDAPYVEPFTHDELPLVKKYGKVHKELGSGAGGSVRLIIRPLDGKTFAVKEFRPRRNTESFKDYTRKCTAEYCIGSTLRHANIIKTIDILHENNRYYEVMEYAPIDFFAVVMSGEMSRQEINCCLKQILEGISYLHSLGLAHRDLKLDNCVLTNEGILKIIDFGSAVIFKYPYDQYGLKHEIHHCHGVVGLDPYLAPEVLTSLNSYNPQPVDLWSIAIIYCCMTLKRFPWKIPSPEKDNSFRLYAMDDDNWHDYDLSNACHKLLLRQRHLKNIVARLNKKKKLLKAKEEGADSPSPPPEILAKHAPSPGPDSAATHAGEDAELDEKLKALGAVDILSIEQSQEILEELKQIDKQLDEYERIKNEMKNSFAQQRNREHHTQHVDLDHATAGKEDPAGNMRRSKSNHKQIHGPYRLMRLLPHVSRPIIHKMLQIDPLKRATIEEILEDDWIKGIKCCTLIPGRKTSNKSIDEDGDLVFERGKPSHEHTVVCEDEKKE